MDLTFSHYFLDDVVIEAYTLDLVPGEPLKKTVLESYRWERMSSELQKKWAWYFRYRCALLQIKYPRATIMHESYRSDFQHPDCISYMLKCKISARKRKISMAETQLNNLRKNELFGIETDPRYPATIAKIDEWKDALAKMEDEYQAYQQNKYA